MTTETGTIEIREVSGEERIATSHPVTAYAFGASPTAPDLESARRDEMYSEKASTLVAFIDDQPQATLASHLMTQNVRGTVMPMGGIAAVATMPSGRRRGAVRAMFERQMAMYHDAGVSISMLYPFRDSFYERLGYAPLPSARFLTVNPESLSPLVRTEKAGSCEQVAMRDGFETWRAFLERYQQQTHGFALKHLSNAAIWRDTNTRWLALAHDERGELVGAMAYKITDYSGQMIARTFHTTNALGRYLLLDWVGRHADQVKEAIIEVRADDVAETWYRDLKATVRTDVEHAWPGPMARIVDVAGLDGINCGDGAVSVRVQDALCPWNDSAFTFSGDGGTLSVKLGGDARSRITIQGLTALVFTGADPATFPYRGWGDPDAATADALRRLFPPIVPEVFELF